MINPSNLRDLSNELENMLGTPVSIKILENITEAQRNFLARLIYKWTQGEDNTATVYSILDDGKSKLKPRVYSDKAKNYLQAKKLI